MVEEKFEFFKNNELLLDSTLLTKSLRSSFAWSQVSKKFELFEHFELLIRSCRIPLENMKNSIVVFKYPFQSSQIGKEETQKYKDKQIAFKNNEFWFFFSPKMQSRRELEEEENV